MANLIFGYVELEVLVEYLRKDIYLAVRGYV